jgi:hypothetical protein
MCAEDCSDNRWSRFGRDIVLVKVQVVDYLINELGLGEVICIIVHTLYVDAFETWNATRYILRSSSVRPIC